MSYECEEEDACMAYECEEEDACMAYERVLRTSSCKYFVGTLFCKRDV